MVGGKVNQSLHDDLNVGNVDFKASSIIAHQYSSLFAPQRGKPVHSSVFQVKLAEYARTISFIWLIEVVSLVYVEDTTRDSANR